MERDITQEYLARLPDWHSGQNAAQDDPESVLLGLTLDDEDGEKEPATEQEEAAAAAAPATAEEDAADVDATAAAPGDAGAAETQDAEDSKPPSA